MRRTVAIQAGGQSSRMGEDKGLVPLAGKPLVEHVLQRVQGLGDEIIITTNEPEGYRYLDLPLHGDRQPGNGALEGLRTALNAASGEQLLLVACDMPFLQPALLKHLLAAGQEADVTVPRWQEQLQPFCSLYSKRCLGPVESTLAKGRMSMVSFHSEVSVRVIEQEAVRAHDPKGLSFFNVNTPEELEEAERIYAGRFADDGP